MTGPVASSTERRAAQRLKTLIDVSDLVSRFDDHQINGDLMPAVAERLSARRFRSRLERRFLRRTGLADSLDTLADSEAPVVAGLGEAGLRAVIVDTGVMCQYAILRRIVDQSVLAELSRHLGLDLIRHDARRAVQGMSIDLARVIASPCHAANQETETVINAILHDGLQCWTCWIHGQSQSLRPFFNALTPSLPQDRGVIASDGCHPRDCRRRADLFAARLQKVLKDRNDSMQRDA